jgi:hypothetical protein
MSRLWFTVQTALSIIGVLALVLWGHNLLKRAYSTECINVEDETNVTAQLNEPREGFQVGVYGAIMDPRQINPGVPGSFPLPNPGNPGTAYAANAKMHPAASAALGTPARQNPLNGGRGR